MLLPDIRKEYRLVNRLLGLLFLALAVAPLIVNIAGAGSRLPSCAMLRLTGQPCASCGLTRSVLALYSGHPALSWAWHPAGILFVFLVLAQLFLRFVYRRKNSPWGPWIDLGQLVLTGVLFGFALNTLSSSLA